MSNIVNEEIKVENVDAIVDIVEAVTESSGMSATTKAVIGLVTTAVTIIGGVFGYKAYRKRKENAKVVKPSGDNPVEVTDEMIKEVTE